ncbi:MAG TPA: hypothetical protein VN920_07780, partial [Pyrinomonadaceae bacterium]|nr:hypothetical protein [Pyrinomonadaceae bacterium]
IAQSPNGAGGATDQKAAVLNEEQKEQQDADEAEAKEQAGETVDTTLMNTDEETNAAAPRKATDSAAKPSNSKVKPVMMQVPKRDDSAKPAAGSKAAKRTPAADNRPRRVGGEQP